MRYVFMSSTLSSFKSWGFAKGQGDILGILAVFAQFLLDVVWRSTIPSLATS